MMMDTTRASMLEKTIQQIVIGTNESPLAATAKLSECSQCGMRFGDIERYLMHTRDKCAASQMIEKPTGLKHQVPPLKLDKLAGQKLTSSSSKKQVA
jgi:hypothetical protein